MFPLWLKIAYTAFLAVLIPVYRRQYGVGNFLWFSDVALILGCAAIWLEHPLLASTQALAVAVPDGAWIVEFLVRLATGNRVTGLTDYMWDSSIPRSVRALSLFHLWLPILLLWMVWRLGYDARALVVQTVISSTVLLASYTLTKPADNVNLAHRWGKIRGVRALMISAVVFPFGCYLPAHLIFVRLF